MLVALEQFCSTFHHTRRDRRDPPPPSQQEVLPMSTSADRPPHADPGELIQRAVAAFSRGTQALLHSRLECGVWCHEFFCSRAAAGFDRVESGKVLAAALRPFAQTQRDGNPATLARLWRVAAELGGLTAEALTAGRAQLGAITVGALEALSSLVIRPEGGEEYRVFSDDPDKVRAARELWDLAREDRASRAVLARRVRQLRAGPPAAQPGPGTNWPAGPAQDGPAPAGPANGKGPSDQRGVAGGLLKSAAAATPANLAESLAEQLGAAADPHDTFLRLLTAIGGAPWADAPTRRAALAGLVILKRGQAPAPVEAAQQLTGAQKNGHATPA
jgi:hypothetical protein